MAFDWFRRRRSDGSDRPDDKGGRASRDMPATRADRAALPFAVGDCIAKTYRVRDIIEGGMATVYVCHHEGWQIDLVVKVPNTEILADPNCRSRILVEAEAWTDLGLHPHIAYCYYVHQIEGIPLLVIEYLDGGNLRQWISDGMGADLRAGMDLAIQLCHGLEHAHARGMIHRDIKPENVLLASDGTLKITDFGIVRIRGVRTGSVVGPAAPVSNGGGLPEREEGNVGAIGTDEYMAPEQWFDSSKVDVRADIFAFGICLYEMFSGRRPYGKAVGPRQEAPTPRRSWKSDPLPSRLCSLMMRTVDWDPFHRPESVQEIRHELCAIYEDLFNRPSAWASLPEVSLEADGWNNRGVSYLELRQEGEAVRCFVQALKSDPVHLEASYNLAVLQWRRAEIDDAEALRRLVRLGTDANGGRALALARAEIHQERFDPEASRTELTRYPGVYDEYFEGWEASQVSLLRTFGSEADAVSAVALTRYGHRALSGGADGLLRLWETESGQCLCLPQEHTGFILALALTSTGDQALSGSTDNTLRLWDLDSKRCRRVLGGHTESVTTVALSRDGCWALSGSDDTTIRLWDLQSGQCLRVLTGHSEPVVAVALGPDHQWALSGGADGTLILWDLATGKGRFTVRGHPGRVRAVTLCEDGETAMSTDLEGTIKLWKVESGQCIRIIPGGGDLVRSVAFSMDGRWAVLGGIDGAVRIRDLQTCRYVRTLHGHMGDVTALAFSPDGGRILSGGEDATVKLWHTDLSRPVGQRFKICRPRQFGVLRAQQEAMDAGLREIGTLRASGQHREAYDLLISLWGPVGFRSNRQMESLYEELRAKGVSGDLLSTFSRSLGVHREGCSSVGVSADGRHVLSGSKDTTLKLWDSDTGHCVCTFRIASHPIWAVALSADRSRALSSSEDYTVRVWDSTAGRCLCTLTGHANWVGAVAVTPDGRLGLSGSFDGTLRVWDLEAGQCRNVLKGHTNWVNAIAICPDGRWAVSGSGDHTVRVWDLWTGQCARVLRGHTGDVRAIGLSPDGRRVLSGSQDHDLRLWDMESGRCVCALEGHAAPVTALSLSADGRRALSAGYDNTLKVWDVESGTCMRTVEVASRINGVAMTADACKAVSVHEDGSLTYWRFVWSLNFPGTGRQGDFRHGSNRLQGAPS